MINVSTFLSDKIGNEQCFDVVITTKRYGNENSWTLGTCKNDQVYENDQTYTESCCLNPGSYQLSCDDTYGDGWHGGYIEIEGTRYCKDFVSDHQQGHNIDIAHSGNLFLQNYMRGNNQNIITLQDFNISLYTNYLFL